MTTLRNSEADVHTSNGRHNGRHDRRRKRRRQRRYLERGTFLVGAYASSDPVRTGKAIDAQVKHHSVGRRAAIAALAIRTSPNGKVTVTDLTHAGVARAYEVSRSSLAQALRRKTEELIAIANNWRPLELSEDRLRHEIRQAGVDCALNVACEVAAADGEEVIL